MDEKLEKEIKYCKEKIMSYGTKNDRFIRWGILGIILLTLFIIISMSIVIVPAGYTGIKLRFGAAQEPYLDQGLTFIIPFVDSVKKMEVKTQKIVSTSEAASKDLQSVKTTIAVNFNLIKSQTPELYQNVGIDYDKRIIEPATHEILKAITATYTAEELITQRPRVKSDIENALKVRLIARGINVEEISITDFQFSSSFNEAIEAKVTAEQKKLQAERDLERIKIEAQQIEAEAIGRKNAEIARAEGQAQAINIIEMQLRQSPSYLEYYKLDKWDGVLPKVIGEANAFIALD